MKTFTFSTFEKKSDNSAKELSLTLNELFSLLSKPSIRDKKDGQLICGAIFNDGFVKDKKDPTNEIEAKKLRSKKTAIQSNLLILDFDHIETIDLSIWQNMGIAFAAYTTFSHATNDKPCAYRIVIPLLNPILPDKYPLLYQWAFEKSNGLIDPACKDISRMQYLPACPKERKKNFKFFSNIGTFLDWQPLIIPYEAAQKPISSPQNGVVAQTTKNAHTQNGRDYSAFVNAAIENEINNVRSAANGTRNATLNKSAFALGQFISTSWANIHENNIESLLFDAALNCGLSSNEATQTIRSGLESGKPQPREKPQSNDLKKSNRIKSSPPSNESKDSSSPLDLPLNTDKFVHVHNDKPMSTLANFEVLLKEYNISLKRNIISKEDEFYLNGEKLKGSESDNIAHAQLLNICRINKMSTAEIIPYSTLVASNFEYNPIVDWIESKEWDGTNRFKELFETIETPHEYTDDLKGLLLSKWFLSCVAAAYNKNNQFWSKGVLVFQGEQSIAKTSWLKSLLPNEMADCFKDGVSLDLESKDSILKAISHWIVELGELDATFKKSDIAKLKAFISEKTDIVRRPYAKRESKYPRQTVFCASVNNKDFLKDSTGNVRFWVIPVTNLNAYHNIDMQQVWAQITTYYKQGETWWLTREEEQLLESSNQQFTVENRFATPLHSRFDWTSPKLTRLTTHEALSFIGINNPSYGDLVEVNKLLTDWFGKIKQSGKTRFFETHAIF